MAFTYLGDFSTDLDKVRFHLQDTVENNGPKPSNKNFTDAELTALISLEGRWERAVAAGFETLAAAWQPETSFSVYDGSFTQSDAAKGYRELAKQWRARFGDAMTATEELGAKELDFSGDTVTPLFQREAFGYKVIDWDPE